MKYKLTKVSKISASDPELYAKKPVDQHDTSVHRVSHN